MGAKEPLLSPEKVDDFVKSGRRDKRPTAPMKEGKQFLNTRVPKTTVKALKKYCIDHEISVQQFINEALERSLRDKGAL